MLPVSTIVLAACSSDSSGGPAPEVRPLQVVGADVSSLLAVEQGGATFSDAEGSADALPILKRNGVNFARVRLFHTPDRSRELVNDLAYDIALAQRIRAAGLGLLLDIHYSDTWADPGSQSKPRAWEGLTFPQLRDSVYAYTRHVVAAFRDAGATPDIVQVGNEVNVGMLFPDGHADQVDADWARFAELVSAGREGARDALGAGEDLTIMHHVADPSVVEWHMDNLLRHLEPPDLLGISYYPMWHGSPATLRAVLTRLAEKYALPIVIVETAHPWTNAWVDAYDDVYHGAPANGMPPYTPQGQAAFLRELVAALRAVPNELGAGLFYWEPAWLPGEGFGSPVDNLTLFTAAGAALPGLAALGEASSAAAP